MKFIGVKTRIMLPPQDDLYKLFDEFLPTLQEDDVVLIASKILAIHQGRCVRVEDVENKDDLIKKEAEYYIPREECPGEYVVLTVKEHTLIPTAGIDESNADEHYILWPEHINESAQEIHSYLKKKFNLKNLGVIITDSRSVPFRYGVVGISIGFYGLNPLHSYVGKKDIFGRKMKMSRTNIVDGLSAVAVLEMGEGAEQVPIVIARELRGLIEFTDEDFSQELFIPKNEDIYYPLLKRFYDDPQK